MRGQSDGYWWPKHQRVDARALAREIADEIEEVKLELAQAKAERAPYEDDFDPCALCGHGE